MTAAEVRDLLANAAVADGGWGYHAGQSSHPEPTCLALVALAAEPQKFQPKLLRALRYLASQSLPDGSYRLAHGRPQAAWTTALVLFAKQAVNADGAERGRVADRLLTLEGRVVARDPEVEDMIDIDQQLLGWPWAEQTFSWVEPTAWACLALRAAGQGGHPRVREGLRLLLDRAFDTGGVNYGNRVVLGKPTEPIPGPTAVMLMALQGVDGPRVDAAVGYLRLHATRTTDLEHLAWIRLALTCHTDDNATRDSLPAIDARIRESLAIELPRDGDLRCGPLRLALAALALDADSRNPFRLTDVPTVGSGESLGASRTAADPLEFAEKPAAKTVGEKLFGFFMKGVGNLRRYPASSAVHIARADDYDGDLLAVLKTQFAHFRGHLPVAGKRVVLKPNLVEYHRDKVINTDPRFVDAVIRLFQEEGAAEVVVAEGPGHWRNVAYLVNESGLGDVLRARGVRFVDINHDEPVKRPNLGQLTGLQYLYLAKTVVDADILVSLPKLKTHHWAGATLSLKNLFGTLPGICYGWPKNELHWRGIPNSIIDIACTNPPHLAIVDGIVGMEGDGPLNGTAKPVGALVMGLDLVAVDATCCRLMGLPVERIPTLVLGERKRLGVFDAAKIPQLGVPIEELARPFEWPPHLERMLLQATEVAAS